MMKKKSMTKISRKDFIPLLKQGKTVQFPAEGNSMSPNVRSGDIWTIEPIDFETLVVGDAVFCKLSETNYPVHKVLEIFPDEIKIGNNHGYVNGLVKKENIFGRSTDFMRRNYYIEKLQAGETVSFREGGNSMTPILNHRALATVEPISDYDTLEKGDIVYVTVSGSTFTHLISAIKGSGDEKRFQISNNHSHVNGWVPKNKIWGKLIAIEGVPYKVKQNANS